MSQGDTFVLAGTGSTVGDAATRVTTSRSGGRSTGRMAAASSAASRLERWKNRGSTSTEFSVVSTFAISQTLVTQRRPSQSGATTSGCFWISSAATFR